MADPAASKPRRVALLERIARGADAARSMHEDRGALARSVLRNMTAVLNCRLGSAAAQMDLGIPSPHELLQGWPAGLNQTLQDIRTCIERYEPRLYNVVVRHVKPEPGDLSIRFQISALLGGGDGRAPIAFTTNISRDGRVKLGDS